MTIFDGRYEQEKLLGQGAFSEVWKVKDTQTGVTLALKIYNPTSGAGEDGNEMLTHEFALMVNASHKNLLRPLFFATCDKRPYLILPYCERGNIGNMVGKMSEEEGWKLLRDTASALAYLHGMNPPILHQDIKPANILLGDNGDYMLTDFGVSTQVKASLSRVSNQEMALFSAGTISYMAPERFSRNNLPTMSNDIYSLGSTVYEMLSGYLPFGNDGGLLQKKGAEIPELQGNFSPLMKSTLEACLQEEPWKRPIAEKLEETANNALRHPECRNTVPQPQQQARPTTLQVPKELVEDGQRESQMKKTVVMAKQDDGIKGTVIETPPQHFGEEDKKGKSKKTLYVAIAAAAIAVGIAASLWLFGHGQQTPEPEPEPVVNKDSAEYVACMKLFTYDDSVSVAFNRMKALAQKGYKDAIHQMAYTYAPIPSDQESARRKTMMGWNLRNDGLLSEYEQKQECIYWTNKAIEASDSTDYNSLSWIAYYYYFGKEEKVEADIETGEAKAVYLWKKAKELAIQANDIDFLKNINRVLSNTN